MSEFSTTLRGIYLVRDLSEVVYDQPYILQQYVQRPLTVDGFKFDLRYGMHDACCVGHDLMC